MGMSAVAELKDRRKGPAGVEPEPKKYLGIVLLSPVQPSKPSSEILVMNSHKPSRSLPFDRSRCKMAWKAAVKIPAFAYAFQVVRWRPQITYVP